MESIEEASEGLMNNTFETGKLKRKRKPPKKFIWEMPPIPKQKPPAKKQRKQFKQTFEVEDILEVQGIGKDRLYLVKWLGFDSTENSWEPAKNFDKEYINSWERAHKLKEKQEKERNLFEVPINTDADVERASCTAEHLTCPQSSEGEKDPHKGTENKNPEAIEKQTITHESPSIITESLPVPKSKTSWTFQQLMPRNKIERLTEDSEWDNICTLCHVGGNLLMCESCPRCYHKSCMDRFAQNEGVPWEFKQDDDEPVHCFQCKYRTHTDTCVLTGLQPGEDARLIPCSRCPRSFHPEIQNFSKFSTLSIQRDGKWLCPLCHSNTTTKTTSEIEAVLSNAARILDTLPQNHWGSLISTRIRSTLLLEQHLNQKVDINPKSGCAQTSELYDYQARLWHLFKESEMKRVAVPDSSVDHTADCDELGVLRKRFHANGFAVPPLSSKFCLGADVVQKAYTAVQEQFNRNTELVFRLDLTEQLEEIGFRTFKLRGRGRYDLQVPDLDQIEEIRDDAPWLPLVEEILGAGFVRLSTSCIMSLPGSEMQGYHSDGDHMDPLFQLPPHCLNVFVPLCDVTSQMGPTEFVPGSHVNYITTNRSQAPCLSQGQPLLFDHRTKHRGTPNKSNKHRALLYITYAKLWFIEANNLGIGKNYNVLPELPTADSRDARLHKRMQAKSLQKVIPKKSSPKGNMTNPKKQEEANGEEANPNIEKEASKGESILLD